MKPMEGIDVVVHNAVCQKDRFELSSHKLYTNSNFLGTLNLFYAATLKKIHVVAPSSEVVPGFYSWNAEKDGRAFYYNEFTPYNPKNIYDISKVFMEQIGHYYCNLHGFSVTMLRYENFWDPNKCLCPDFV